MPTPEQIEVAELLARHAKGDLTVAEKIAPDPEVEDGPVGFHAQQAVEKALKVALTLNGVDFPKTHDLDYLTTLADSHLIALDSALRSASWLTPWAAEFRYDDAPIDTLNRERAIETAEAAVLWCQELIANAGAAGDLRDNPSSGPDSSAG
ncbi:MAG TPA: HEPN domain-containing protein [Solirubrobacterales bacterium]